MMIKKEGEKYVVYSEDGKKKLGSYNTEEESKKRLKQVEYFKHTKESVDIVWEAVDYTQTAIS